MVKDCPMESWNLKMEQLKKSKITQMDIGIFLDFVIDVYM